MQIRVSEGASGSGPPDGHVHAVGRSPSTREPNSSELFGTEFKRRGRAENVSALFPFSLHLAFVFVCVL